MVLHNNLEGLFNIANQYVSVFDIDAELSLDSLVNLNGGFYIDVSSLISPVGHETEWHALKISRKLHSICRGRTCSICC